MEITLDSYEAHAPLPCFNEHLFVLDIGTGTKCGILECCTSRVVRTKA
jgi:hypothetical protein